MRFALVFLFLSCAASARAEDAQALFDLRLLGFKLGEVRMQRRMDGPDYSEAAKFATTGVVGVLARVHFDIEAQGRMRGSQPQSGYYVEDMDTGRRQSRAKVRFEPGDARIDPMSALYAGLGDRPADWGCGLDREVFDGTRTHRLTIVPVERETGSLTCEGRYYRTAGYTPEELAGHKGYSFTVTYLERDGLLIAQNARADTQYGRVSLLRR